jgi:hypothetical protein
MEVAGGNGIKAVYDLQSYWTSMAAILASLFSLKGSPCINKIVLCVMCYVLCYVMLCYVMLCYVML